MESPSKQAVSRRGGYRVGGIAAIGGMAVMILLQFYTDRSFIRCITDTTHKATKDETTLRNSATSTREANVIQVSQESIATSATTGNEMTRGWKIVTKAYKQTYKALESNCRPDEQFSACVSRLHDRPNFKDMNFPWWFETLIRDGVEPQGMHGRWHQVTFPMSEDATQELTKGRNTNFTDAGILDFCTIEKVSTTEWRHATCLIRNETFKGRPCYQYDRSPKRPHFKAVFLRDPLERFLSGFKNKCLTVYRRKEEQHCEPGEVFLSDVAEKTSKKIRKQRDMVTMLTENNKLFFEAYVDTMPLSWNVHFFPQSMSCDGLFRHIKDYDFVGLMGDEYHENLRKMGEQFNLTEVIAKAFKLDLQRNDDNGHVQKLPGARPRAAAGLVQDFYNPHTVRRILEYMSIDYVMLGLEIPQWAEDILATEDDL